MNPWIAKAVILVANVVLIAIRAPHGHRSRSIKVVKSRKGTLEIVLLSLMWIAFFVPLIWIAVPAFSFAEYRLGAGPLVAGIVCFAAGLWLFFRSHAELGTNWSLSLEVRDQHQLITHGVYRSIRHLMYTAFFLYSIGQALVIPNWVVGPSYLVPFTILFACRVGSEERMMVEQFGDEYTAYVTRSKHLVPGIW